MAQASRSGTQEYWRPANPDVARLIDSSTTTAACWNCGTEYPAGALFCHVCGSSREKRAATTVSAIVSGKSQVFSKRWLTANISSLLCFIAGLLCVVAAAVTGAIYRIGNLTDWQAVQLWRIEWLLAAAVCMLAGIFLKKSGR